MSRLEFRTAVALPRPRSAVAMVALATLTIAITEQIQLWAIAANVVALVWTAARSHRPAAWQSNAKILNVGLAFTVSVGALLWWQGDLALVALAHFAVLTQGLQLLDVRPRKSEFLLVALAIFQVTMAANLTDSAFFPPLLVAFTVATVWTLLIHTLRAEAIEAGEPASAQRVVSAGLLRTTLVASLVSILLAAALFPLLPRIRSGAIFDKGFGPSHNISGFSDQVELGEIGRIRQDPTVMLQIETDEGPVLSASNRYWRGLAFDHFDGKRWSVTPSMRQRVAGAPEIGVHLGGAREGVRIVQQVIREGVSPGVLFSPGLPTGMRGAVGRLERDVNGSLFAHSTTNKRVSYRISTRVRPRNRLDLANDEALPPRENGDRYLQLPELRPEVAELARRIVADATTDAERAVRIESWLLENGRYTDSPPAFGSERSPVENFLLDDTQGHCEYFASSMVVLARMAGLPARLVNGYASGHENSVGGFIEVAQSDAHTWVEVHFKKAGWVRFDPTPPDLRMAGSLAMRQEGWRELASAVELWWFTNVVDFDRGHQARALRDLWLSWHRWRKERREGNGAPEGSSAAPDAEGFAPGANGALWGFGMVALIVIMAAADFRRRKRRAALPDYYARALRVLRRSGLERETGETARSFARAVAQEIPEAGARAFETLTEAYLRERFGGEPAGAHAEELALLRDSIRA